MALLVVALRVLLGFAFMFTGAVKVTDRISPELYAKGLDEFAKLTEVLSLKEFGFHIEPIVYLTAVGCIEVIGGLLLAIGPKIMQELSNVVLSLIMMGVIYSLLMLKKPVYMCIPATVCLGMLMLLLYVWGRDRKKQKEE